MKDKKLQIFVSSTFTDLKEERQAAVEAILSSGHIPAGMELFSAGDETQMNVIKRWIDESDIYLLILGGRYGSIEPISGKSYTHLEYEYALSLKKPLFSVVINPSALELKVRSLGTSVFEQENPVLLKEFKEKVLSNMVKFWEDKKDIKIAIHETLADFGFRKELIGWIRGDNAVNGVVLEEIARLTKENSEFRESLLNQTQVNKNSLYSNMTYEELAELLTRTKIEDAGKQISLLDYLLLIGSRFTNSTGILNEEAFKNLLKFKIIQNDHSSSLRRYVFSEDGHNFYLKLLLKSGI